MNSLLSASLFFILQSFSILAFASSGSVQSFEIRSEALSGVLMGQNPNRTVQVYLPPGYATSKDRYPTIYYIPNMTADLDDLASLLDRAIELGHIRPHIFVTADFSMPSGPNFMGNNVVVGRWLDFITDEWIPQVDSRYRTLPRVESRGVAGHFLGANAAMKIAMFRPDLVTSVYAFHPVGTDLGERSPLNLPDWDNVHSALSFDDLEGYAIPFVSMAQAYLPNPSRPPLYADMIVEREAGALTPAPANAAKLWKSFFIGELIYDYADNLSRLKAIKFDWGRRDSNPDHVYANQRLSNKLSAIGIEHEALEHGGTGFDYAWDESGYFYQHLLPFFQENLAF